MSSDQLSCLEAKDKKNLIGFWSLVSIVMSAELGVSIFGLPSHLAKYGTYGIVGWIVGGIGAILIALTFAFLVRHTGIVCSSSSYVRMCFGEKAGFFMNWVYWCGSWVCNPIIISIAVDCLTKITGDLSPSVRLAIEILIVLVLTCINANGLKVSSKFEFVMTILKIMPLVIVPLCSIKFMSAENLTEISKQNPDTSILKTILAASLMSFWGFVGLEGCTSASDFVKNPQKTVPLAIVLGTAFVTFISLVNTLSIFLVIGPDQLKVIDAPFTHVMINLFGDHSRWLIGIMTFVMCVGSLNAWVLFSGQIARSSSNENLLPKYFGTLNKNKAPGLSLWIGGLGTIIVLCILKLPFIKSDVIGDVLDMSVVVYIVIYTMSVVAYLRFAVKNKIKSFSKYLISIAALFFCFVVLINTDWRNFLLLFGMFATGIPVYIQLKKQKK